MSTTTARLAQAFGAVGLTPQAKLVLILAANGADMDGRRPAPFRDLAERANVTDGALRAAFLELERASLIKIHADPLGALGGECLELLDGPDGG